MTQNKNIRESRRPKESVTGADIKGQVNENKIAVTLGELYVYSRKFQKFMTLPKSAILTMQLSSCFNRQYLPQLETLQKTINGLYEQYGIEQKDGTFDLSQASEDNRKAFNEEYAAVQKTIVHLDLKKISMKEICSFVDKHNKRVEENNKIAKANGQPEQPEIIITDELMIPFLFVE